MKTGSEHSIEGLKFFPVIAWSIFGLFALFVFLLANELQDTTAAIEAATHTALEYQAPATTTLTR